MSRNARRLLHRTLIVGAVLACVSFVATGAGAAPGGYSQTDVDNSIRRGVDWLSTQQHPMDPSDTAAAGSWDSGSGFAPAESGLAIVSYGVLANGDLSFGTVPNASDADRARWRQDFEQGVDYLLSSQNSNGSWGGFLATYSTGINLLALSYATPLQSPSRDISGSIAKGRHFLLMTQSASPSVTGNNGQEAGAGIPGPTAACTTDPADTTSRFCGGWDYSPQVANYQRSDESNTGFALTGLAATGGVPQAAADANVGWQRNIQMLATNPYTANAVRDDGKRPNDGGGSYVPQSTQGSFSSNANDTGSLIFGFAYDKVPGNDTGVQAAIAFGNDILDMYEHQKDVPNAPRTMIYHANGDREPTCTIGDAGCGWRSGQGEGGYHYSIFALSKGLGQYQPSDLTNPANFYAKVVDLLLSQQFGGADANTGSWPEDPRDDGSQIGATAFAIMSLGRVGQAPKVSGTVFEDTNANKKRDPGENGLDGWTVFADVNNDGALQNNEPRATTASGGAYTLQEGLPEGHVTIREVLQSGYECTTPDGCAQGLDLTLGATRTVNFGNRKPPAATSGVKGARACGSARRFVIKVRIRRKLRKDVLSVRITVAGKKVRAHKRGSRWVAVVNLRGKPKGTYRVRIRVKLRGGRVKRGTRTYHTCIKGIKHGPPPM